MSLSLSLSLSLCLFISPSLVFSGAVSSSWVSSRAGPVKVDGSRKKVFRHGLLFLSLFIYDGCHLLVMTAVPVSPLSSLSPTRRPEEHLRPIDFSIVPAIPAAPALAGRAVKRLRQYAEKAESANGADLTINEKKTRRSLMQLMAQ